MVAGLGKRAAIIRDCSKHPFTENIRARMAFTSSRHFSWCHRGHGGCPKGLANTKPKPAGDFRKDHRPENSHNSVGEGVFPSILRTKNADLMSRSSARDCCRYLPTPRLLGELSNSLRAKLCTQHKRLQCKLNVIPHHIVVSSSTWLTTEKSSTVQEQQISTACQACVLYTVE